MAGDVQGRKKCNSDHKALRLLHLDFTKKKIKKEILKKKIKIKKHKKTHLMCSLK